MLIIAEKPSIAESFAKALNADERKGFFENEKNGIQITWCYGHLYELIKPEGYLKQGESTWNIENLPVIPEKYKYQIKYKCNEQVEIINRLIRNHNKDKIIVATDADREGEVIARIVLQESHALYDYHNCYRFWESEALVPAVVHKGLNNLKPLSDYNILAKQGFARQHADWLVGMNLSDYIAIDNQGSFSVGRVQTALLAAIVQRNNEVKNFVPVPYLECCVEIEDNEHNIIKALLINPETKKTMFKPDSEYIKAAYEYLSTKPFITGESRLVTKTICPPKLLSLTDLSKIAAEKFDYSAAETLDIAQKLYEEYKCLSYPRTPSNVLGDDDIELYKEIFNKLKSNYKYSSCCNVNNIDLTNKRVFNSKKLESHHALIPLDILPARATEKEKNIYQIVFENFFQCIMDNFIYDEKQIIFTSGDYHLRGTTKIIKQLGWKESSNEEELKTFSSGYNEKNSAIKNVMKVNKMTQPKKEFTEASLLQFMKNPQNEDEENVKLVGLGTEATRGEIIKKLFTQEYVQKKNKSIIATNKGIYLINVLSKDDDLKKITDIAQTTIWEKEIDENPLQFEQGIITYVKSCIKDKSNMEKYEYDNYGKCPLCSEGKIFRNKFKYYCSKYKDGCRFGISYHICDAVILPGDVEAMLLGKLSRIKNMKSKNGKPFKAKVKLIVHQDSVETELVFQK